MALLLLCCGSRKGMGLKKAVGILICITLGKPTLYEQFMDCQQPGSHAMHCRGISHADRGSP